MERHARALVALTASAAAAALIATAVAGPALARDRDSAVAFKPGTGQSVIDWNKQLITIINTPKIQPPTIHPTRSFAMLQAAEYDAVVSITHADPPYLLPVDAPGRARPDAAADQAAHDVLTALYPQMAPAVNQLLAAELKAIPDGTAKLEGIKVGSTVAARLVQERSSDGSGGAPAAFVRARGPATTAPPRPTSLLRCSRTGGPSGPLSWSAGTSSAPQPLPRSPVPTTAAALNEVESMGRDSSTTRTADQTSIARFWGAAPIWNAWNEIAQKTLMSTGRASRTP